MLIQIYAIGEKFPDWVHQAIEDYSTRLSGHCKLQVNSYPTPSRKRLNIEKAKDKESQSLLKSIQPQDYVIALDEKGKHLSSVAWSRAIESWQLGAERVCFLIGGPDGLSPACLARANACWSMSQLTLPHALARVLLLEQLYRAFSILNHHPYHRE